METSQIRIYEILQSKFSKEESETLVSEIRNLQELNLLDKIDARVSRAESNIVNNIIWKVLAISGGQLAILLAVLKLFG